MVESNITFTPHLHLAKLPANYRVWSQIMNDNLTTLDASINGFVQFSNLRGTWTNSTVYAVGDTVVDPLTAILYTALVDHTSALIPTTFTEDSAANPTYWTLANSPATNRGVWSGPGTAYNVNDFVLADGVKYAMCIIQHVSAASFTIDEANQFWEVLIDLTVAGSLVLPVLNGPPDAVKFVTTNTAGTAYEIVNGTTAMARLDGTLPVEKGGTGAITATGFGSNVLNNTPTIISPTITGVASATVLHVSSQLTGSTASFTGEIAAATPATADNDTTVATTAFVKAQNYVTSTTAGLTYLPLTGGTLTGALYATDTTIPAVANANRGFSTAYYDDAGPHWYVQLYNYGGGYGEGIYLGYARGSPSAPTAVQSGDWITGIIAQGYNGSVFRAAASIDFYSDGAVGTVVPARVELTTRTATDTSNVWSFKSDGSTTLPGALNGTTANFNGALHVAASDGAQSILANGASKGVRIFSTSTGTNIEGVDNTGSGSFQPLNIGGSIVNIAAPLTGTTATLSGALTAASCTVSSGVNPAVAWTNTANGADLKRWDFFEWTDGNMHLRSLTDAGAQQSEFAFGRNGSLTLAGALTGTSATFSGTVLATGAQIQIASTQTGAVATGTTLLPLDDTIPQITEGDQYMTLAITPKSATSRLVIDVTLVGTSSAVNNLTVALFQDAAVNALAAAVSGILSAGLVVTTSFRHTMISGTTSATTFRVRAGGNAAATTTFNGSGGIRYLGGIMASSITIRETVP